MLRTKHRQNNSRSPINGFCTAFFGSVIKNLFGNVVTPVEQKRSLLARTFFVQRNGTRLRPTGLTSTHCWHCFGSPCPNGRAVLCFAQNTAKTTRVHPMNGFCARAFCNYRDEQFSAPYRRIQLLIARRVSTLFEDNVC